MLGSDKIDGIPSNIEALVLYNIQGIQVFMVKPKGL
jgi:hypothetical protein